jgi:hypothetical protein
MRKAVCLIIVAVCLVYAVDFVYAAPACSTLNQITCLNDCNEAKCQKNPISKQFVNTGNKCGSCETNLQASLCASLPSQERCNADGKIERCQNNTPYVMGKAINYSWVLTARTCPCPANTRCASFANQTRCADGVKTECVDLTNTCAIQWKVVNYANCASFANQTRCNAGVKTECVDLTNTCAIQWKVVNYAKCASLANQIRCNAGVKTECVDRPNACDYAWVDVVGTDCASLGPNQTKCVGERKLQCVDRKSMCDKIWQDIGLCIETCPPGNDCASLGSNQTKCVNTRKFQCVDRVNACGYDFLDIGSCGPLPIVNPIVSGVNIDGLDSAGVGCYISYTSDCKGGFGYKQSLGTWGRCKDGMNYLPKPVGYDCETGTEETLGNAILCCPD